MKKAIQPYESHMQYIPQWMCDYNLYGCAYMNSAKVLFRGPVPDYLDINTASHQWHSRSIPPSMISDEAVFTRQSHCSIEVDICVQDILNRLDIQPRLLHHDFVEQGRSFTNDEKLVHSMAGLWKDETRRRKLRLGLKDSNSSPFPPEVLVSVSADPRNTQPGGWVHEQEYKAMILALQAEERASLNGHKVGYEDFVKPAPLHDQVRTAFESVEDLYPMNLSKAINLQQLLNHAGISHDLGKNEIEVDESRISPALTDDSASESDEDNAYGVESLEQEQDNQGTSSQGKDNSNIVLTESGKNPKKIEPIQATRGDANSNSASGLTQAHSSSELEDLGVRNAGDYTHIAEDAFIIPAEYASDLGILVAQNGMEQHTAESKTVSRKRRKLVHDEGQDSSLGNTCIPPENHPSSVSNALDTERLISMSERHTRDFKMAEGSERSQKAPKANSPGNLEKENSRLPYVVAKDDQDHHAIQRLSQRSHSSIKRSTGSQVSEPLLDDSELQPPAFGRQSVQSSIQVNRRSPAPSQIVEMASNIHKSFNLSEATTTLCFGRRPPTSSQNLESWNEMRLLSMIYPAAHYSNDEDVPLRGREYAGKEFKLEGISVPFLPDFDPTCGGTAPTSPELRLAINSDRRFGKRWYRGARDTCNLRTWEIEKLPPTRLDVERWLREPTFGFAWTDQSTLCNGKGDLSQIDAPTPRNKLGFKYSQKQPSISVSHETGYMSLMSLEIHVNTRESLAPNPEKDEISCIVWCLKAENEESNTNSGWNGAQAGIITLSESQGFAHNTSWDTGVKVDNEATELDLINRVIDIVREHDPDVLTGFEVHNSSWGYVIERARQKFDYDICDEFSRMKSQSHGRIGKERDRWGFNQTSTIRVTGRHMINIWRAMRGELSLLQYTMENIAFHTLHRRIPHFSFSDLTKWYRSNKPRDRAKVIEYYLTRVQANLEILEQNELIPRTSEQARLLGVDFFSVFSRGSQFKVESLMFRIAKPENFILVSPSRKQVGQQNALECLPLVMEPQSALYTSPVLVLDFQSLYPSVMIAYNYCYSTFLGRVVQWRGQNKMGFTDFKREVGLLDLLKEDINIAPNGMIYVKPNVRKSLLAKMLGEILETRVMVKSGMKVDKDDRTLQRLLNNRQLVLKLIANVTYGYTSASFSGRMPCSEIADSIVQTGRETLEKAIALIHSVERWDAEVVYGDTDSLFVHLKGRSRAEAFRIGKQIAQAVTDMNPRPVKLKFEKIYHPCVLLAKKRYVGFKFESESQEEPEFDAKGIETVRRDGTPGEQKIEEKALKILFRTADLSQVKAYFQKQCAKIMKGKVSIQDFCFAREVKLGTYSDKGPLPPGALISTRRMLEDPRAEPQYGERVPYVVIAGAPGARLIDRCVAPEVLLNDDQNELDSEYYISKNIIPPLERIFNLVGANVRQWYDEMPKYQRIRRVEGTMSGQGREFVLSRKTLESYMKSSACLVCRARLDGSFPICLACQKQPESSLFALRSGLRAKESRAAHLARLCRSCAGFPFGDEVTCDSKDCPVFYTRTRHAAKLESQRAMAEPIMRIFARAEATQVEW